MNRVKVTSSRTVFNIRGVVECASEIGRKDQKEN
jgi:hypothetical protein